MVNVLAVAPILAVTLIAADSTSIGEFPLESGEEAAQVVMSLDGNSLFAAIKYEKYQNLVVWDIPSKSKTVLVKRADFVLIMPWDGDRSWLSPDGKSLLGFVVTMHADKYDATAFVLDIARRARTNLFTKTGSQFLSLRGEFSPDGAVLAIPDANANVIRLWSHNPPQWRGSGVLNLAHSGNLQNPIEITTAFTPDGKDLFVSVFMSNLAQWAIEKWSVAAHRKLDFQTKPIKSEFGLAHAAVSAKGDTLCLHVPEGTFGVNTSSGKAAYSFPTGSGFLFVSPDGRTATIVKVLLVAYDYPGRMTSIYVWRIADGTSRKIVSVPGAGTPWGRFSADSCFFVYAPNDHTVQVMEVAKASVHSSSSVAACVKGIFLLKSGELAVVGVEGNAINISKIKVPRESKAKP